MGFVAPPNAWLCVMREDGSREEGSVGSMSTRFISEVAAVLGVEDDVLLKRWRTCRDEHDRPADSAVDHLGTELGGDPLEGGLSASFTMNDRGGLHARPAVLLQQALEGLPFRYVMAEHASRRALLYGAAPPEGPKPLAFWLLLLRLGARHGGVVRFTIRADDTRDAEMVLDTISGVLGRSKPERFDFWRELGLERWCETYMEELAIPEARALTKRHQLFDKADTEPGPEPPPGSPMATRGARREGRRPRIGRQPKLVEDAAIVVQSCVLGVQIRRGYAFSGRHRESAHSL